MIIGTVVLLLFEVCYRNSIIDFYKGELEILNKDADSNTDQVDYLVFGDSFSAAQPGYIDFLRDERNANFINTSVPGIGIAQVNTFAQRRIKKYKPKHIVYQVYVENDLTDIQQLTNWSTLSFPRNVYWTISSKLRSLSYLNYRLASFKSDGSKARSRSIKKTFDAKRYDKRTKLYFASNSYYS